MMYPDYFLAAKALLDKRITNLVERKEEPQEIKVPDYTRHFEELKTMVRQHSLAYSSLQIYAQINHVKKPYPNCLRFCR